jgi:hypothetical protein
VTAIEPNTANSLLIVPHSLTYNLIFRTIFNNEIEKSTKTTKYFVHYINLTMEVQEIQELEYHIDNLDVFGRHEY